MNTQRLIYKLTSWPVTLAICLVIVLGTVAIRLWPRTVPFEQCSKVYQNYASHPGLQSAFIKDFRFDKSMYFDVTLLQATTDSSWNVLKEDFNISFPADAVLPTDSNAVSFWFAPRDHYDLPMDTVLLNNDLIVVSQYKKTVLILHIKNEDQINAIVYRQIINTKNKKQQ